jgi:hypothetical protein
VWENERKTDRVCEASTHEDAKFAKDGIAAEYGTCHNVDGGYQTETQQSGMGTDEHTGGGETIRN